MTELKNEILSGALKPGEFILPENTLSEKYKISRVSVRKVLAQLVEEGLIEKIAGKGNRVKPPQDEIQRQPLKLTWFSGSYETDIVRRIIERYEATHPYVKVELIILPAEEYAPRVAKMMEEGTGPDLFFVSDAHFRHFSDLDKLHLFEPYTPSAIDAGRDSFPVVFDMFTHDGRLLATPFLFSPVVICYNVDMFEKHGISRDNPIPTWDELLEVAKRCTTDSNGDGMIEQYGFCFSSSLNRWPAFVLQNGGAFKSEDGERSIFANERNVEALQFCLDLMYKHHVSPIYSHGSSYLAENLFKKERVAMILSTYYFMNEFRGQNLRWDVLPLPAQRQKATLLLGGALGINKGSDKKKVAQSLIEFMVGEEAQTLLKQHGCTIPVLRKVAEDDSLLDPDIHPPHYNNFLVNMPYAASLQGLKMSKKEVDVLHDELHVLWANMEATDSVCRRVEEKMNRVLAMRKRNA